MQELKNTLNFISQCLMFILAVCCKVQRSEDTKQLRYKWDIEFFMNELYDQVTQTNHVSKNLPEYNHKSFQNLNLEELFRETVDPDHVELISTQPRPPSWARRRRALSVQIPSLPSFLYWRNRDSILLWYKSSTPNVGLWPLASLRGPYPWPKIHSV